MTGSHVVSNGWAHARIALQRQLVYRFSNWSGLFTNCFFLYFRAYALRACYEHRDSIGGLDVAQIVTYVTVSQAFLMVIPAWGKVGVADSVRSGQIAIDLARPTDFVTCYLGSRFGVSTYYSVARALPLLVVGGLAGFLTLPPIGVLPIFLLSVVLAAWIAHLILLLIELSSFWLGSEQGVRWLVLGFSSLFSGLILPIDFFPAWAQMLSRFLPFEQTLYAPTSVWIGAEAGVLSVVGVQFLWAVLLTALARTVFQAGRREVLVHGG
ncbi:MAG: ABC-2 family transporter protein [Candidatus Eisenbacteria bacterium]